MRLHSTRITNNNNSRVAVKYPADDDQVRSVVLNVLLPEDCSDYVVIDEHNAVDDWCDTFRTKDPFAR